jgi:Asp-tRNA(Asn)/Glu-tRNA(Gln) amidotransferase A subunit family amidase
VSDALWRLTIAEAADLVRTRRLSPVELTEALIARTATFDGQIHAYITPTPERALESARAAATADRCTAYRSA